jgi:ABC-type multidrug transport system fused ATPase/permease subunit
MDLATSVSEASQLGLEYDVFDVHEEALSRMNELIERTRQRGQQLQFATGLATPMYVGLAYMALIGSLGFVAASDATSLTSLGAAMLVMLRSLSYGQALQGATVSVSAATPVIEEFGLQLDQLDLGRRRSGGEPLEAIGEIGADGLSFSYEDGREVLTDISFTIRPREVVGIVGPSGSGKSTLVQLLLGLREPSSGRVLANGRDIRTLDRRQWARKITFVPQDAHLITGTIAENIEFLRGGVSRDDIEDAARLANLHDDIIELPDGYERVLGSGGARLSGGQQQRLCIARALVERPDVLILDEPTSALDPRSESLLRGALLRLADHMTVIVIAHRLSTLDICDRIMVVQHGRMVGFDAPDRLRESSTFFRDALAVSDLH